MVKSLSIGLFTWLLQITLSILGVIFLCFVFLKTIPGSPFDEDTPLAPTIKSALEEDWGLKESALQQSLKFTSAVLHGNWGQSVSRPTMSVLEIIRNDLQTTLGLNLIAFIFVILFSFLFTGWSLYVNNPRVENIFRSLTAALSSLPTFFWAPFLIFVVGDKLGILPPFFDGTITGYVLPLIAIFMRPWASLSWILFDQWKISLRSRSILFAKAKGLQRSKIIFSHGFRLSIIPFIQKSGQIFLQIISGSFVVEILFGFKGLASDLVWAISTRDSTVVVGIALVYCVMSLFVTQTMEVLSRQLDPRWKVSYEA